jgi:hypothetical protein
MKKLSVLFFVLLLLISFASAQFGNVENTVEELEDNLDNVEEFLDSPEEEAKEYLRRERTKFLESSKGGRFILGVSNLFNNLSPVFKIIIHVEYSLSWLFFLSLGLWIAFVFVFYLTIKDVIIKNSLINFLIAIVSATLISQFGGLQRIIELTLPLFESAIVAIIFSVLIMVLVYIYSLFSESFREKLKEKFKENKEERRERKAEISEEIHDIEIENLKNSGKD